MKKENNQIRIAHIIGNWFGGGVEAVVMNYYRHMDRSKIQFDFICSEESTDIPYDEISNLGGRVFLIPSYSKVFEYQKRLISIFKENNYKIVHSHISTMSIFPLRAAKKSGVPIRIAHSHSTTNKKEKSKNLMKEVLRLFSRLYATDYMCCSELAGRWLFGDKLYNENKIYLLNNAIDLKKFKFDVEIRKKLRVELGIDDNTLVIGHMGRFVQQKNHDKLIDIFNEINKLREDSILILAGQGPLLNDIKEKVEKLKLVKNVRFLGQVNNSNQLYQAFDVFLLPSLYEGLPVVGVEAQAASLLCFLSDEMTKETMILSSTKFMPLSKSSKEWAYIILKSFYKYQRNDTIDEISLKGFNIDIEANKLENKYLKLKEEIGD